MGNVSCTQDDDYNITPIESHGARVSVNLFLSRGLRRKGGRFPGLGSLPNPASVSFGSE